jgi:uncharacterized membrane protein YfcA
MYLQGLGFDRDALIQAMGMLFALSTLALAVVLASHDLMNGRLGTASLLALAPAVFGMVVGQRIRQRLPEERFRRVFFVSLLVLGGYIALRSSMQL